MDEMKKQQCPICSKNECTLREEGIDVPHFGKMFIFSIQCDACSFRKADVEAADHHEGIKTSFEVKDEKDLDIRVIKSSQATLKIPRIMTITPGPESEGYVTNVEGVFTRVKAILESTMNAEEDSSDKKKLKNMIKKINKILVGRESIKISIEDPTGNSAILSDKAEKKKL